jgi:hypothetical protein
LPGRQLHLDDGGELLPSWRHSSISLPVTLGSKSS